MTVLGDFGPLVIATDIDDAVTGMLAEWLPTYLSQIERERGLPPDALPRPVRSSISNTLDSMEFLDHQLPAVIVTTSQTTGTPARHADGNWAAHWRVVVSAIVRGNRPPETRQTAALFEGTVRRLLQQQMVFSEALTVNSCRPVQSLVQPVADSTGKGRYLAAGVTTVELSVQDSVGDGPSVPRTPDDAYVLPDGVATGDTDVEVDVEGVGISQTLGGSV